MLPGDPEGAAANHQIPTDGRVPGDVRAAVTDLRQPAKCPLPAHAWVLKVADRLAICLEEQEVVVDVACSHERNSKLEMALQHADCSRAQDDSAVVAGLGAILVDAVDPCLRDIERSAHQIAVADTQRDLL